jgi:RNA polymerase sigma-70 factor (ECF subfamily)
VDPEKAFDQHHESVFRFAYRLTRSAEAAEDITQDCFLALVRAPDRFDESRGTLRTYLFSIARNLAFKVYRDGRLEEALEEEPAAPGEDEVLRGELAGAVQIAVAALPPLQQEALILFEYEGLSLEEIARVAGTESGTIKSRLYRARERLKRVLAPFAGVGVVL